MLWLLLCLGRRGRLQLHAGLDEPEGVGEEDHDDPGLERRQQVVHRGQRPRRALLLREEAAFVL